MTRRLALGLLTVCGLAMASLAHAGYMEIGATANYRRSAIDDGNKQESISYTTSMSYYFWELSAIEISYTNGYNVLTVTPPGDLRTTNEMNFELVGADLVITLGSREAVLQPYVKLGTAYMKKEIFRQVQGFDKIKTGESEGLVPSAGVGFKVGLTKQLSIKVGVDAWTSPLDDDPVTVDYAGRAGISWMF